MSKRITTSAAPKKLARAARVLTFLAIALGALGAVAVAAARAYSSAHSVNVMSYAFLALGLTSGAILMWRLYLVNQYRALPSPADRLLPEVTVIVPAFNEGRLVYDTLASLRASDYPHDLLHIIAVDDGSSDDTWTWIERAQRDLGTSAIHCARNRGKRHALYEGFRRAKGEVLVTVDSDSVVRPDTLRNLLAPLVADERVGGVAGVVRVLNPRNVIPRMLDVSFTYAFEFIRASESVLGAVVCCPGALSAYRRELIDEVKDEWLAQTVWGRPANIGEDRALTNHVLKGGHRVVLQSNAVVYTDVPSSFSKLHRMLLRWARSNVRETMVLGRFVFTDFRQQHKNAMRVLFAHHALRMVIAGLGFVPSLIAIALHPSLLLWIATAALLAAGVPSAVYALCRRPRHCVWGFAYALMSAFALTWITPLALLTSHRTGWLTRGVGSPA